MKNETEVCLLAVGQEADRQVGSDGVMYGEEGGICMIGV